MSRSALSVCSLCTLVFAGAVAHAQTNSTYMSVLPPDWSEVANWSDGVPDNNGVTTFHAIIPGGSPLVDGSFTIDRLTVDMGAHLRIENGRGLTIIGDPDIMDGDFSTGLLINRDFIEMLSIGSLTNLAVAGGTLTISSGGSGALANIQMGNSADRIYGINGTEVLINEGGHRIFGGGSLGYNRLSIINSGVIAANVGTLTLDPNNDGITNLGSLRARDGARLLIVGGTSVLSNNVIESFSGGLVELDANASIDGGNLIEAGGGVLIDGRVTMDNVRTVGEIDIDNGAGIDVIDSLVVEGRIDFSMGVGSLTSLRILNDATLSGNGEIFLANQSSNRIHGATGPFTLTNSNCTIRGGGSLGYNAINIINNSLITADGEDMVIDPSATFVNNNTVRCENGGNIALAGGTYHNTSGTFDVGDGVITSTSITFDSGTILSSVTRGTPGHWLCNGTNLFINYNSSVEMHVPNGSTMDVTGNFNNSSVITLNSVGSLTSLRLNSDITLSGGGEIQLSRVTGANRLTSNGGPHTLTNDDHLIIGSGQIGYNNTNIVNNSIIRADGIKLTIDPAATLDNNGVIDSINGTPLALENAIYDNLDGVIDTDVGTTTITAATILGGELTGSGGYFDSRASTFDDILLTAPMLIVNGNSATIITEIDNRQMITLDSIGSLTNLFHAGDAMLVGGGDIVMKSSARVVPTGGVATLTNVDNLIRGGGNIGYNQGNFINQNTVRADGASLTLDPSGFCTNESLFESVNGGVLIITGPGFDNTNGMIIADTGTVNLNSATVTGGLIAASAGGTVQQTNSTLSNLTLDADVEIVNGRTLTFEGAFEHTGIITVATIGSLTRLRCLGDVTLTGGGTIDLSAGSSAVLDSASGIATLTNVDHTIFGQGNIGYNNLNVINQGDVLANSGTLTIDPPTFFTNEGLFQVGPGNAIVQPGTFTNDGDLIIDVGSTFSRPSGQDTLQAANGETTVEGTMDLGNGTFTLNGGVLGGDGSIEAGNVNNVAGDVSPGGSVGNLTIIGGYTQQAGGTLSIEADNLSSSDLLTVTGAAFVDGTIRLIIGAGYTPAIGDSFRVIDCTSTSGMIATVELVNGPNGLGAAATTDALGVLVEIIGMCEGDVNGDNMVNFTDLNILLDNWGMTVTPGTDGDVDESGEVNFNDLNLLLDNWGLDCT